MAVIKCKMCGGNLEITEGMTVAECEYCGSTQTVPSIDSEKKIKLFERANKLRSACEFDKAYGVYESIVAEYEEEAEAYWGLVLCKYGIEYVDDPKDGRKVPTCHRSSYDSIMDDENLELAMENTDAIARQVYREEAKQIEEIRKKIIEVSMKEEPYDIFICYKETDENGERTLDSVLAQDVYDALTAKGYRVFFSRITLEDKLGVEYEPYIFGALNSAKIMLVFGTNYEYYHAVWVKNEWNRFLKIMENDHEKYLIPCYKDIDAYDIPKEFAKLQAQDLGKVGAIQDLVWGIKKLLGGNKNEIIIEDSILEETSQNKINNLLKRGFEELADGNWNEAKDKFENVLMIDGENARAYIGLFMFKYHLKEEANILEKGKESIIKDGVDIYESERYLKNAYQYAQTEYKKVLDEWKLDTKYEVAMKIWEGVDTTKEFGQAAKLFHELGKYRDSEDKAKQCLILQQMQTEYEKAVKMKTEANTATQFGNAAKLFQKLGDYENAKQEAEDCLLKQKQKEEYAVYKEYQNDVENLNQNAKTMPEVKKYWEDLNWIVEYKSKIHFDYIPDETLLHVAGILQALCFCKSFFGINYYTLYQIVYILSFVIWGIVIYKGTESKIVTAIILVIIYVIDVNYMWFGGKIGIFFEYAWVVCFLIVIIRIFVLQTRKKSNGKKRNEIAKYKSQAEQDAECIRKIWSAEYKKLFEQYAELGSLRMEEKEALAAVIDELNELLK